MRNGLVLDRARYDTLNEGMSQAYLLYGTSGRFVQFLDYYVIEEEDGSATFIKNRMPLPGKGYDHYSAEDYAEWKQSVADYEVFRKEIKEQNEKALAAAKKRGYTVDPRITEAGIN